MQSPMRDRTLLLALPLSLALLAGCGGGGGADPAPALKVAFDFSRAASGTLAGRSVRLRVQDANGAALAGQIVEVGANGTVALPLKTRGEVRLLADLYSGASASGDVVGAVDARVVPGSAPVAISVGESVAAVRVSPDGATLPAGAARPYSAAALGASGAYTFAAPGSFAFSALGGAVEVTPVGVVSALAPGAASVRATHTPTGVVGAASVTVTPTVVQRKKWTVMVYLNSANDLYTFSKLNVNGMEAVAGNPDVRFVVQWKLSRALYPDVLFDGTRRYLLKADATSDVASTPVQDLGPGVDMGSPATLSNFVAWAKANYPADRYALVIWNHGNGWRRTANAESRAVSYDDELGTSIQTWQLADALKTGTGNVPLDILSWDASLMQQLEVAYEVKDAARFIVGSEESPPGEGLPYDAVFRAFRDNPDGDTRALTKSFVDGMLSVPAYATRKITQSALDTSKLAPLASALDELGAALAAGRANIPGLPAIRAAAQSYSQSGPRIYRDLADVCLRIENATSDPAILAASQKVRARLADAVAWEGHNANSPGSKGLSIDFSDGANFATSLTDYRRLKLAADTRWDEFLAQAP